MQDLDKTTRFHYTTSQSSEIIVTIFDAKQQPHNIALTNKTKVALAFGRADDNDIVLESHLVSRHHGRFVFVDGKWYIEDLGSTNGLIYNNANIKRREIVFN